MPCELAGWEELLGCRVLGLRFREFRAFKDVHLGFRIFVEGFGSLFRVYGFMGLGFGTSGLGFRK